MVILTRDMTHDLNGTATSHLSQKEQAPETVRSEVIP
uniref:Uncharacterized protein n=1 Tax=Arundo donax TaxID=35708 RepID=A0A0A9GZ48_ARUDO